MQASVHEAKTNFSRRLEAVGRGERVVIARHGIPDAELTPARPSTLRIGSLKGMVAPSPEAFLALLDEDELGDWEKACQRFCSAPTPPRRPSRMIRAFRPPHGRF